MEKSDFNICGNRFMSIKHDLWWGRL